MAAHPTPLTHRRGRRGLLRLVTIVLVVATCSLLAGASAQPRPPRRIVTVIPAVTEILFAIGAGAQVVGIGSFDTLPEGQPEIARVGGLLDPDMEQIFALRPDLVILYASQTEQRQQVERAGIPVMRYAHAGLADIADTTRELGHRTGHAERAEAIATALEDGIDAVRARVAGRSRPRTLLVFAREPASLRNIYASGGIGFLHDMLEAAGGDNVFAEVREERVAQASAEIILASAPEVIIEIRNSGGFDDDVLARERAVWERLSALPAVEVGAIHFLSGGEFVVPGPRVLGAVQQLARLLHPTAF